MSRPVLLGFLVAAFCMAAASPAHADSIHGFEQSFGSAGEGPGEMELVAPDYEASPQVAGSGLAVDSTTHHVYVADTGNERIDEFEADGTFVRAFGWGVADGSPALQTCTLTCRRGIAGTGPGQLDAPTFIALDNSPGGDGELYVGDGQAGIVQKFTAEGELVSGWGEGGRLTASPILAEGSGDLTAGSREITGVQATSGEFAEGQELSGEGIEAGTFIEGGVSGGVVRLSRPATQTGAGIALTARRPFDMPAGIAVDPGGDLWVYSASAAMFEFGQDSTYIRSWEGPGATAAGIAFGHADDVYLLSGGLRQVVRLTSTGTEVGALTPNAASSTGNPPPTGLAADQVGGDLYVDLGESIEHLSATCDPSSGPCPVKELFGSPQLREGAGLAVDSSTGHLYAADPGAQQISVFDPVLQASTGAATAVGADRATLAGTVDPEGRPLSECEFEYGASDEYGDGVPCVESVGSGTSPVPVHADLTGLQGGSTYHFRLSAASAAGTVAGEDETFTTAQTPVISGVEVGDLGADSAELLARIDPEGQPTRYQFEYGPSTAYGTKVPLPAAEVGSGTTPVAVSQQLEALSPGTTYDFRVLATAPGGVTVASPNHTFVVGLGASGLPDGRQYELVTPPQKNAALIGALFLHNVPPQISADGERLIVASAQCFADSPSCVGSRQTEGEPYVLERRGQDGWQPDPLAPPVSEHETNSWWAISAETGGALFSSSDATAAEEDFYVRGSSGAQRLIGPIGEAGTLYSQLQQEPLLATADFSRLVYGTVEPVWAFDQAEGHDGATARSLYEYVTGRPQPILVGVGGPRSGEGSTDLISTCGTGLGDGGSSGLGKRLGALSQDGTVIYFTALPCPAGGTGANEGDAVAASALYMRIDGEAPDARTVAVSAPVGSSCETPVCVANASSSSAARDANFEGASADGSVAIFSSTGQLTDDATQDPSPGDSATIGCTLTSSEGSGCNLYLSRCIDRCQTPSGRTLTDISAAPAGGPRVQGTLALSPDGSHVYFVAKGVLTDAPNDEGARAHQGLENLYVSDAGHLAFIAALSPADAPTWEENTAQGASANVTPDGRYLLFTSRRGLTADARQGDGPAQVYRYDAATGSLIRISIGEVGYGDDGNLAAGDARIVGVSGAVEAATVPERTDPSISDDGSYVFFQSPAALVPGALDNVPANNLGEVVSYAQNVYEYHEGHVYLISDGKDSSRTNRVAHFSVELLGTDPGGENVFFSTVDPLTWQDTDTQRDFYDARIGGGIPEPAATAPCAGEGCRGPASSAGASPTAATSSFSGPGNQPPKAHKPKKKKKHRHRHKKRHPQKHRHEKKRKGTHTGNRAGHGKGGRR
ncbi:MAG TPA: hypothetical protein VHZ54_10500 [Solirubrobacterales bacterium]|nr:hypothetical protein [Solirubrobacterales bacterium]